MESKPKKVRIREGSTVSRASEGEVDTRSLCFSVEDLPLVWKRLNQIPAGNLIARDLEQLDSVRTS